MAHLKYWANYLTSEEIVEIEKQWKTVTFEYENRKWKTARRSAAFGPGFRYKYNGGDKIGKKWPEWLLPLVNHLGQPFTHALLNDFPKGTGMPDHSDNETEYIVPNSIIAAISLFGTCHLQIKTNPPEKRSFRNS